MSGPINGTSSMNRQAQMLNNAPKVPMPGVNGVSFKDVAATHGVFNNLKLNAAPKINLPTK